MADNSKDPEVTEPPQQRDTMKGFGSFKVKLADILTFATVIRLATLFEYPPRIIEELEKKENRSNVMIRHMEERGQIQPNDITLLLDGLKKLDLIGTETKVRELFEDQTGLGCTDDRNLLQQKRKDFGEFKVNVAAELARNDVKILSTFFNLTKAASDAIIHSNTPGLDLVNTLEAQGKVEPIDISQLIDGLRKCNLGGVADKIQQAYLSNVSNQPVAKATKQAFINQLKMSYKTLCDKIKPVPFMKNKLFSIGDIYVQGGMKVLVRSGGDEQSNVWSPLESHDEILMNNPKTKSKRKIIEGEPGYGKSTILLQYLHDWCSGNPKSTLKDTEIVIHLKFRQLKGITSIYKAVKLTLLPKDSTITEYDIKNIIQSCKSVVIFLDGYDEYPDKSVQDTDFLHIVGMEMFHDIDVIVTTRMSNLPPNITAEAKRFCLTGFGKQNRENYILKVVAPGNLRAANMIETQLERNPIVGDLCESPLFFAMVAYIAHEREDLEIFRTATRFCQFIEECFHSHMRNKDLGITDDMIRKFQTDHSELDRLAFEGLCGQQHQQLSWERSIMVRRVGPEFCNYYVRMGMLVEEEVFDVSGRSDVLQFMRTLIQLGFPHKIFCEYYASFHLAAQIAKAQATGTSVEHILSQFNPLDLQYLYRFTCGLNKAASEHVIKYLQKTRDGQKFAVLCMLEQEENSEQFLQTVTELVSGETTFISKLDTKLLQRSMIQILDLASAYEIPISELRLQWSFRGFDGDNIRLESGLCISSPSSVEKISINGDNALNSDGSNQQLSEGEVTGLLNFGIKSRRFTELWFHNCKLPPSINPASIPEEAKSRNAKVLSPNEAQSLSLKSGGWEKPEDVETIKTMCSGPLAIDNRTSKSVQRSVIELLVKATSHDIPISQVNLNWSFDKIDEDGLNIILKSGLLLPNISSMERMTIQTEDGREMKEEEVNGILNYLQQNKRFKELDLADCVLPSLIRLGPAADTLRSRNVKVFWIPDYSKFHQHYLLDLTRGHWDEIVSW